MGWDASDETWYSNVFSPTLDDHITLFTVYKFQVEIFVEKWRWQCHHWKLWNLTKLILIKMKSYRPSPICTLYMYIMKTWEENKIFYIKHHLHIYIIIYMLMMSVIKFFVFLSCWFYWEEILYNNKVNIKIWRKLRSKLNKQTYICHINIYNIFYNVLDSFPAC